MKRRVSIPQAVWIACNGSEPVVDAPRRRFNTASGMDCMQLYTTMTNLLSPNCFNTASGMDCMQCRSSFCCEDFLAFQYRKRYGLHAINMGLISLYLRYKFQYRKRYGLHAIVYLSATIGSFNEFQYRKRYGLHAIIDEFKRVLRTTLQVSIPQAVWIACNSVRAYVEALPARVSIPQAVWIACNTVSRKLWKQ